jgi:hypothetical protein
MEFVEKFIAFVDILGFSGFVADAERGAGRSLDDLLSSFGSPATTGSVVRADRLPEQKVP